MRRSGLIGWAVACLLVAAGCAADPPARDHDGAVELTGRAALAPHRVCGVPRTAHRTPPAGAVVVRPGTRLDRVVAARPAGTTYWLAPGTHTLGTGRYSQVLPHDGDRFLGAPGSVLDGRRVNRYAFGGTAVDVSLDGLAVRGFGTRAGNQNEGVVNHDSGTGWRIARSTISGNAGAGVMLGDRNVLTASCLRDNGQYAFNAYRGGDGITDLVVSDNEISGNNTDDWERRIEGCGCTGGGKFWAVRGAEVTGNYVHDNHGPGLWADTDNTGFLFSGNYVADNDAEGIFYEISYNARVTGNAFVRNGLVKGPTNPGFPTGALYLSESGSDDRVPGPYGASFEVDHNAFVDNWSGVVGWENADRFAGSEANTSSGYDTLVNAGTPEDCADPSRGTEQPRYDDCRWRTQHLDVHDNTFRFDPAHLPGCRTSTGCGYTALIANWGTYPPYQRDVVQQAIVHDQHNTWRANRYLGPWRFLVGDPAHRVGFDRWRSAYGQDEGSTSSDDG